MKFADLPGLPERGGDDEPVTQLIYRSVSTRGVASALHMSDILAEARSRNAELGVTGVLTAVDGQFIQIIEAPQASVDTLLASLSLDPRHTAIQVLERRQVSGRAFGDWEMVSPRLAGLEAAQISLLLSSEAEDIDQYIPVFKEAIRRQNAVLAGVESPTSPDGELSAAPFLSPNTDQAKSSGV